MKNVPRVEQFEGKNHFTIQVDNGIYLQSYKSVVAFRPSNGNTPTLGKHWDYSKTTMKYVNHFMNSTAKETRAKIKSGAYIYDKEMV